VARDDEEENAEELDEADAADDAAEAAMNAGLAAQDMEQKLREQDESGADLEDGVTEQEADDKAAEAAQSEEVPPIHTRATGAGRQGAECGWAGRRT
jgi:hypothetical protein